MRRLALLTAVALIAAAPLAAQPPLPARVGSVAGTVLVDSLNTPIANADVRVGETGATARTDSTGRFEMLRVPAGIHQLLIRAVGFEPYGQPISVTNNGRLEVDVRLTRDVQQLRAVKTEAAGAAPAMARARWMDGFDERKKFGIGHFVTADQLSGVDGKRWSTEVIARVPGLRIARFSSRSAFITSRGLVSIQRQPRGDETDRKMGAPVACYPIIIVDDIVRYGGGLGEQLFDLEMIDGTQIAAVEFYTTAQVPPRFNRSGSAACGALLIWQK